MNCDLNVLNYIKNREQGLFLKYRSKQLSLQQSLIINNESKTDIIRNGDIQHEYNTKAFLIVMSIDKSYFAVATSENSVGIYCSVSGELLYKLIGSPSPVYTISWHPYFKNIIACTNFNGSVFVWDIYQTNNMECHFMKIWTWVPFSSIIYSIGFHPFRSIMTLARDREIRFIDWEKGEHIAQWRFYSEFSWVPWISWSFVGSSILVSVGNPQNNCVLLSMIESVNIDQRKLSPIQCGCSHYNNNSLCEICDTCDKMSMLDGSPPSFEEYRINAVDLIRYILSRPEEWFLKIFICVNCRLRFKLWADSIQIHNKYDVNPDRSQQKCQLPDDVESSFVTVIESPVAPEVVWELLQKLDRTSISDRRLQKYIIPQSDPVLIAESKSLLRSLAMFERECLRQSICWCCIQQIHHWILQEEDFTLFLYQSMVQVRQMVIERVKDYDMNMFKVDGDVIGNSGKLLVENQEAEPQQNSFHAEQLCKEPPDTDSSNPNEANPVNSIYGDNIDSSDYLSFNKFHSSEADLYNNSLDDRQLIHDNRLKRLTYLHLTLKFLQLYVSEPSRLGDLINIYLSNNLSHSGMMGPTANGSKIDSYSIRKWHLEPFGTTLQKISPRYKCSESNVVVPYLIFSGTGLTESSIKMSKCGRKIAVFVPRNIFQNHYSIQSDEKIATRKRRHSVAFDDIEGLPNTFPILMHPVIAIYSSEPECSCGQLLYYFEMPHDPISLDFSPLGDHLIVGLSGSQNQSFLFWSNSNISSKSRNSVIIGSPSDNDCNIGLILKIDGTERDHDTKSHSQSLIKAASRKMQLQHIVNSEKSIINDNFRDTNGYRGPINCVIWNTAGGLIYSKEPGTLFSLNFVGCKV